MLITFTSYLNTVNPDMKKGETGLEAASVTAKPLPFKDWVAQRSELYSMRERLLWHNPLTAMEVHTSVIASIAGNVTGNVTGNVAGGSGRRRAESDCDRRRNLEDEQILHFIAMRSGSVLGSHTILKEDHYPGLQSHILSKVEGAPNFRRASDSLPVYGLAIPTVDGIRQVLDRVGIAPKRAASPSAASAPSAAGACSLIWFNMREEPVVYLNGRPYVLREHARPFKNMQE